MINHSFEWNLYPDKHEKGTVLKEKEPSLYFTFTIMYFSVSLCTISVIFQTDPQSIRSPSRNPLIKGSAAPIVILCFGILLIFI